MKTDREQTGVADPKIGQTNQLRREIMTDEHRQRLSALQDGELDSASVSRLLDAMVADPALRATWRRYNLIGHAMRGETIDLAQWSIADRVRDAMVAEPTILAPRRVERSRWRRAQRLAGFALAASVAFVVFLAAPALFQYANLTPETTTDAPLLVERETVPLRRWQLERPELASKLDLYLVTHQATAPATGARGMLPYATLVGYDLPR